MLLCHHLEQPVSGSEEGGSLAFWKTENFFMLCFVYSWVQGKGTRHHDLDQMRVSMGHQTLFKS
jgi:hypothetical protein